MRAGEDNLGISGSGLEQRVYALQDANYNVTALVADVNGSWIVVQRFSYDPYGNVTILNASGATTADGYNWIYLYQGGRFNAVTKLYTFQNRKYRPATGTWMTQDPAGYVDGANLYQAFASNPTTLIDPSGLDASYDALDFGVMGSIQNETLFILGVGASLSDTISDNFNSEIESAWVVNSIEINVLDANSTAIAPGQIQSYSAVGVGAGIGVVIGGIIGGIVGGLAGTGVEPGGGTVAGGLFGGDEGAAAGAALGGAAGAAAGAAASAVGNLYNDITHFAHRKGARQSTKDTHETGKSRQAQDQRKLEKGDKNRRPGRRRPNGWKGPWPPPWFPPADLSLGCDQGDPGIGVVVV